MNGSSNAAQDSDPVFDAAQLWDAVRNEVIYIYAYWKLYEGLYRKSKETIEVLNEVSGFGFRAIHDALIGSIILRVARLSDPAANRQQSNLSLAKLVEVASADKPTQVGQRLRDSLNQVRADIQPLTLHCHKRLAHNDAEFRLGVKSLPPLPLELFRKAFKSISDLMNEIGEQFGYGFNIFDPVMEPDAVSIVMHLEEGIAMLDFQKRVRMNAISPEELFQEIRRRAL